jgi:hypothetical protein
MLKTYKIKPWHELVELADDVGAFTISDEYSVPVLYFNPPDMEKFYPGMKPYRIVESCLQNIPKTFTHDFTAYPEYWITEGIVIFERMCTEVIRKENK